MLQHYFPLLIILSAGIFYAVYGKKLTVAGAAAGAALATIVFAAFAYNGLAIMTLFFVMGTVATSWKKEEKKGVDPAGEMDKPRAMGQVIANAGVAGLLGVFCRMDNAHCSLYFVMMACAFSAATADTLSSELGMVYGRRFYNVLTFAPDQRGLDGVVSLEGTVAGVVGSTLIAAVASYPLQHAGHAVIVVLAGTLGNLADSVLGATAERKKQMGNDAVNFVNTAVGAVAGALMLWATG